MSPQVARDGVRRRRCLKQQRQHQQQQRQQQQRQQQQHRRSSVAQIITDKHSLAVKLEARTFLSLLHIGIRVEWNK